MTAGQAVPDHKERAKDAADGTKSKAKKTIAEHKQKAKDMTEKQVKSGQPKGVWRWGPN